MKTVFEARWERSSCVRAVIVLWTSNINSEFFCVWWQTFREKEWACKALLRVVREWTLSNARALMNVSLPSLFVSDQMLQQDQWHFLQWHAPSNASRGAVPAGRAGDGASGPGFITVPRPRQPHAFCGPGGQRRIPIRWAQRVLALTAFLLSDQQQWNLSSRQHWWDTFFQKKKFFPCILSSISASSHCTYYAIKFPSYIQASHMITDHLIKFAISRIMRL